VRRVDTPAAGPHKDRASVRRATWAHIDIQCNIREFINGTAKNRGRKPTERYASFDYCFNHFQSFREANRLLELMEPPNLVTSCLHLGFFLASWGMLRGSSFLLRKSVKFFVRLVATIANTPPDHWSIDADRYTTANCEKLDGLAGRIRTALCDKSAPGDEPSDILVTKIMLGVFGSTPAFDNYFVTGSGLRTFGQHALRELGEFYTANADAIETQRKKVTTIDFETGAAASRLYTRAKMIDMIFFVEGQKTAERLRATGQSGRRRGGGA
jgi:hypothetical protein